MPEGDVVTDRDVRHVEVLLETMYQATISAQAVAAQKLTTREALLKSVAGILCDVHSLREIRDRKNFIDLTGSLRIWEGYRQTIYFQKEADPDNPRQKKKVNIRGFPGSDQNGKRIYLNYLGLSSNLSNVQLEMLGRRDHCVMRIDDHIRAETRRRLVERLTPYWRAEWIARKLLRKVTTKEQWSTFEMTGDFFITTQGRHFLLRGYHGVEEYENDPQTNRPGREVLRLFCLHGEDKRLPHSDLLAMQKMYLEADLEGFHETANIDLKSGHPDYDPKQDPVRLPHEEWRKVIRQRNGTEEPTPFRYYFGRSRMSMGWKIWGPRIIIPGIDKD